MIGRLKIILFLVTLMLTLFLALSTTTSTAAVFVTVNNSTGPVADYTSIQKAINNANEGDTILVYPGTYMENVDVNVTDIKIRSFSENPRDTVVLAQNQSDHVFNVSSDLIEISGFTISGARRSGYYCSGIFLYNVSGANISYNILLDNRCGVYLNNSCWNLLIGNNATENTIGIYFANSSNSNILTDNDAIKNYFGIYSIGSSNNILTSNKVKSNYNGIYFVSCNDCSLAENEVKENDFRGIILSSSSNNNLTKNNVYLNIYGIYLGNFSKNNTLIGNSMWDNYYINFEIYNSSISPNTIYSDNLVNGKSIYYFSNASDIILDSSSNAGTIYLIDCTNFTIKDLVLEKNAYGMYLSNTTYSLLENNSVLNNSCGLFMASSSYNTIYNNRFFNRYNVRLENRNIGNIWNATKVPGRNIVDGSYFGGNFWATSDGRGFSQKNLADTNGDSICDLFYSIDGNNTDYLPLLSPSTQILTYDGVGEIAVGSKRWNCTNCDTFFHELINNLETETLTVNITDGRVINENNLVYRTDIKTIKYWSQEGARKEKYYPIIGFFGNMFVPIESRSNGTLETHSDKLAKLLIDSDNKYTLRDSDVFFLGEGYALKVKQIDSKNESVWLELDKDNKFVGEKIVNISSKHDGLYGEDWTVDLDDIENEDNVTVMRLHVNQVLQGAIDRIVQIEDIWLIDYENAFTIEPGDEFGVLTVSSIGDNYLEMKNNKPIILERNSINEIAEGLSFKVFDSPELIYYPFKKLTINLEEDPLINDFYPMASEIYTVEGEVQEFTISTGKSSNITLFINGKEVQSKDLTTYFSYQNSNAPEGIYYVQAVASTEDEEPRHSWIWIVRDSIEGKDGNGGGGRSSGTGGGGGAGGPPEPVKNVEIKELSQAFVTSDKHVKFDFIRNATCVESIEFDAKRTFGKTTAIIEMLKGKSQLASQLPSGIIYKNINIWIGNEGTSSPENIKNAVIDFKVEKSWLTENNVSTSSIRLYRYSKNLWSVLLTKATGEDKNYFYFRAETPGFSPFVIAGEKEVETASLGVMPETEEVNENSVGSRNLTSVKPQGGVKSPSFESWFAISGLLYGVQMLRMKKN